MDKKPILKGIDLSHWNKVTNWDLVAKNVNFVMLKIGGEEGRAGVFKPDSKFLEYYHELDKRHVPVGGYFFAGNKPCIIKASQVTTARMCRRIDEYLKMNDIVFDMPLALDWENQNPASRTSNTMYVEDWCNYMEDLGYYVTIYASDVSGFNETLYSSRLTEFDKWVARYGKEPEFVKNYGIWQYTSTGKLSGVNGNVDLNYAYLDYPDIIRTRGLNR